MDTNTKTTAPVKKKKNPWFYLTAAVIAEGPATASLKAGLENPWFYIVSVIGFVLVFYNLSQAMRQGMGVGIAYGFWGACSVILTAVLSWLLFKEPFTAQMILGIVLIIVGVAFVEFGKPQQAQQLNVAVHK